MVGLLGVQRGRMCPVGQSSPPCVCNHTAAGPQVLAIGLGVGVAAILGTMKFLYGWSLKPLIAATLLPTVGLACYMQW